MGDVVQGDQYLDSQVECNMESIKCGRHLLALGLHQIEVAGVHMKSSKRK